MRAACSATELRTVVRLLGDFAISRRISLIADDSLASRAGSDSRPAAVDLRGGAGLAPPQRLGAAVLRRRGLTDPALERRLMAFPDVQEIALGPTGRPKRACGSQPWDVLHCGTSVNGRNFCFPPRLGGSRFETACKRLRWWSRGENRFIPDYQSRFKDLAGLWLRVV